MPFFDYIRDILVYKAGGLEDSVDFQRDFSPYIVQRWTTMPLKANVRFINLTTNRYLKTFYDNPEEMYRLMVVVCPATNIQKLKYIKRPKREPETEVKATAVKRFAAAAELSEREIREYAELFGINIDE